MKSIEGIATATEVSDIAAADAGHVPSERRDHRWRQSLSFRNMSAIYVLVLLIVVFSIWVPETFLTDTTLKTLLSQQAVTAIIALGLVVPLAAGVYDLSIGYAAGAAAVSLAWLMVEQDQGTIPSVAFAIGVGVLIGLLNGVLVAKVRINSFIATLAMGSILSAFITYLTNNQQIIGLRSDFIDLANTQIFGVTLPVVYMLVLAVVLWYILEHTPIGRYVYATGGNAEAARLAGVRTTRYIFAALVASGTIASLAGIIVTARIGAGAPSVGPPYLLPAFAAAFLGSTQFKQGRPNVWGTVVAVYVLATGVKGLQLAGAPFWLPDLFNGVALLLAVGLAGYKGRLKLGRRGPGTPGDDDDGSG
jgi:ribose transport system permease protein